jgi:hypothetical protein
LEAAHSARLKIGPDAAEIAALQAGYRPLRPPAKGGKRIAGMFASYA